MWRVYRLAAIRCREANIGYVRTEPLPPGALRASRHTPRKGFVVCSKACVCQEVSPAVWSIEPTDHRGELERLAALASFDVLDTSPESAFDDVTALATHLCATPIAMVSLVDADRQWFKSRIGLRDTETPREHSFCAHALYGADTLEVCDTTLDSRFATNPLVTGEPHLRFYAGAPLVTADGHTLGTLCVLDVVPRKLDPAQHRCLSLLAAQTVRLLEMRRQSQALSAEVAARLITDAALRQQQRMLNAVLDHTDVLIYAKDLDGRFVMTNPAVEAATQTPGGLIGRTDHELFPTDIADEYRCNDNRIVRTRERDVFSEDLTHPDGTLHTYRSTKFPLIDDGGTVIGVGGVSTDVTELTRARTAHQEAEQRWRTLVEHSPVAIAVVDANARVAYANPRTVALLGASSIADFEDRSILGLFENQAAEVSEEFAAVLCDRKSLHDRRWTLRQMCGTRIVVELNATPIAYRGDPALQLELRDVTVAAAAHAALQRSAWTDPLTGLLNRRGWESTSAILPTDADRVETQSTIAMIDLDRFKAYNDVHGHSAGDELLRTFAAAARGSLRACDVFARWGGEEFALALPDTSCTQAASVLDRIRAAVPHGQTCSIGYTGWQSHEPLAAALRRADEALFKAKSAGRDQLAHGNEPRPYCLGDEHQHPKSH